MVNRIFYGDETMGLLNEYLDIKVEDWGKEVDEDDVNPFSDTNTDNPTGPDRY